MPDAPGRVRAARVARVAGQGQVWSRGLAGETFTTGSRAAVPELPKRYAHVWELSRRRSSPIATAARGLPVGAGERSLGNLGMWPATVGAAGLAAAAAAAGPRKSNAAATRLVRLYIVLITHGGGGMGENMGQGVREPRGFQARRRSFTSGRRSSRPHVSPTRPRRTPAFSVAPDIPSQRISSPDVRPMAAARGASAAFCSSFGRRAEELNR